MKALFAVALVACGGSAAPPPVQPSVPQYSNEPPADVVVSHPIVVATITRTWAEDNGATRFEVDKGRTHGLDHRMKARIVLGEGTVIEPIHIVHVRGASADLRTSAQLPEGAPLEVQFQDVYIDAKPIRVRVDESSYVITVDRGSDHGLTEQWTAKLLASKHERDGATLVQVQARHSVVTFGGTLDQMPRTIGVRFYPPS